MSGLQLEDRVALVTGSTRGLGREIAERFAREGARVVVNGRSAEDAERVAKKIGAGAIGVAADIGNSTEAQRLVEATRDAFGRVDILVNNAATSRGADRAPILQIPDDEWRRVIDMNLTGTFLITKAVGNAIVAGGEGGSIINIGSIAGREGMPTFGAYAVTKAGLTLFTQVLAKELAQHKINVNCVCPGLIGTHRMTDVTRPGPIRDAVMPTIPLGREGSPEEIGAVVAFLASPGGAYIHGQTINVDGGRVMR